MYGLCMGIWPRALGLTVWKRLCGKNPEFGEIFDNMLCSKGRGTHQMVGCSQAQLIGGFTALGRCLPPNANGGLCQAEVWKTLQFGITFVTYSMEASLWCNLNTFKNKTVFLGQVPFWTLVCTKRLMMTSAPTVQWMRKIRQLPLCMGIRCNTQHAFDCFWLVGT